MKSIKDVAKHFSVYWKSLSHWRQTTGIHCHATHNESTFIDIILSKIQFFILCHCVCLIRITA